MVLFKFLGATPSIKAHIFKHMASYPICTSFVRLSDTAMCELINVNVTRRSTESVSFFDRLLCWSGGLRVLWFHLSEFCEFEGRDDTFKLILDDGW